jgi:hypothetical protein
MEAEKLEEDRLKFLPSDLSVGTAFLRRLPLFLHGKLDRPRAEAILGNRLRNREARFLDLARRGIYEHSSNPYLKLLENAGCAFGDLEELVGKEGLEGTLAVLLASGVYLKVGEFKGRQPLRRPGLTMEIGPESVRNPRADFHIPVKSSGSRSSGTPVLIDLAYVAECAVNCYLMLLARGGEEWVKADWEVPGGGALFRLLKFSRFGKRPERWFSQLDPAAPGLHPRYAWSAKALRLGSLMAGAPLPKLEHVSLDDPMPIVRWMAGVLEKGKAPCLFTFPSSAVRVARAALNAGVELDGARFLISGEPITEARATVIRRAGGRPIARYGTIECGPIGYGCLDPTVPDDLHLHSDLHAIIQAGEWGKREGLPREALFLTTLSPCAPFVFLNVSMGDMAVLDRRDCGCALGALGWHTHASRIRSFEKLTGLGMTFLDTDVVRILEEVLPAVFGGAPTDYQLLEEEGPEGDPVLKLLAHPGLGVLDEGKVREVFFANIGRGSSAKKVMELTWKQAGLFRIERRPPVSTGSGKILHLHVERGAGRL